MTARNRGLQPWKMVHRSPAATIGKSLAKKNRKKFAKPVGCIYFCNQLVSFKSGD